MKNDFPFPTFFSLRKKNCIISWIELKTLMAFQYIFQFYVAWKLNLKQNLNQFSTMRKKQNSTEKWSDFANNLKWLSRLQCQNNRYASFGTFLQIVFGVTNLQFF